MSKFTTPLKLEFLDYKNFRVLEEFSYYRTDDPKDIIIVPKGFVTDFASIPRLFWSILPPSGSSKRNKYGKCAVLHDYLYDKSCIYSVSRKEADEIFLEAMVAMKVSGFVRKLFYYMVRWFGKKNYSNSGSNK